MRTDLLTTGQVAELIGVSRRTVTNMVRDGRLVPWEPPVPPSAGQHLRFEMSEVERFIALRDDDEKE